MYDTVEHSCVAVACRMSHLSEMSTGETLQSWHSPSCCLAHKKHRRFRTLSLKLLRTSKTRSQNGSLCQRINVKNVQAHAMQKRKASRCIESSTSGEKKTQTPFCFSKALNCSTATKDPSYKLRNCTSTLAPKGCSNFAPLQKKTRPSWKALGNLGNGIERSSSWGNVFSVFIFVFFLELMSWFKLLHRASCKLRNPATCFAKRPETRSGHVSPGFCILVRGWLWR